MVRIRDKKKIALVLSGGGIKAAAFHIGVCLALQEKGFKFAGGTKEMVRQNTNENDPMTIRLYVGSSAGAFVASILAAGYSVESLVNAFQVGSGTSPTFEKSDLRYLKPISYRDIFNLNSSGLLKFIPRTLMEKALVTGGFESLLKNGLKLNGLFSTKGMESYLRKEVLLDNDFSRLGVELYVIGTQLNHSRKAIFGNFPESYKTETTKYINYATISDAVACSTALPPVFAPYGIKRPDGKEFFYYDGEIRDTLSTHVAADNGADLVISSFSIQPYHYTKEMGSLHDYGIPLIANQALYQVVQQKIARHIQYKNDIKGIYNAVDGYFKQMNLPSEHREKLLEIIRARVNYRPEVDYIYISPRPQNYEMFFVDHFSLSPEILARIVRIGFKSGISAMRHYDL
ncbi:patatin-like phospholipase family protein [Bdellovibrio reynosensis]|uniref:Patatin-like phospholipase family protein n=1 Tax=Bdellovibrio reynosensis TaxID=2835041 RepID=A0ABY4C657_9BACT|nr:patatin-like phospholipase family protein [Bdellovibrio reynosensis]UOF00432.1 patatin-like phospholipase family protein [Bdellovibrio reynosensis]